jgi:hypothetical protein
MLSMGEIRQTFRKEICQLKAKLGEVECKQDTLILEKKEYYQCTIGPLKDAFKL